MGRSFVRSLAPSIHPSSIDRYCDTEPDSALGLGKRIDFKLRFAYLLLLFPHHHHRPHRPRRQQQAKEKKGKMEKGMKTSNGNGNGKPTYCWVLMMAADNDTMMMRDGTG